MIDWLIDTVYGVCCRLWRFGHCHRDSICRISFENIAFILSIWRRRTLIRYIFVACPLRHHNVGGSSSSWCGGGPATDGWRHARRAKDRLHPADRATGAYMCRCHSLTRHGQTIPTAAGTCRRMIWNQRWQPDARQGRSEMRSVSLLLRVLDGPKLGNGDYTGEDYFWNDFGWLAFGLLFVRHGDFLQTVFID